MRIDEAKALLKLVSGEDLSREDAKNLPVKAVAAFRDHLHRRFGYDFILPHESLDDAMEFSVSTPSPENGSVLVWDFNDT